MCKNISYQSLEEYAEQNPDVWEFLYGSIPVGDYETVDKTFNHGNPVHKEKY